MKNLSRSLLAGMSSLLPVGILAAMSLLNPTGEVDLAAAIYFGALVVLTSYFSAPLDGVLVSLTPMVSLASYLVLGLPGAGWTLLVSLTCAAALQSFKLKSPAHLTASIRLQLFSQALSGAGVQVLSLLIGGAIYQLLEGELPLGRVDGRIFLILLGVAAAYLTSSYLLAAAAPATRGRQYLARYLKAHTPALFFEGLPLIFAPLVALVFNHLGWGVVLMLGAAVAGSAWIYHDLAINRQRLERQLKELEGLQGVGQALSASLDLDTILQAIYDQVIQVMPAQNFFVALYDPDLDVISFPFVVESGRRTSWPARRSGKNLTEHILRSGTPLLSKESTDVTRRKLGLDPPTRPALSWLGVPVTAGGEMVGVITVQSYSSDQVYDASHLEFLTAVASQAAVAIQNARLYARTDQALARRVQQLDSILNASRDGILLLDSSFCVQAANRVLAELLGTVQSALVAREAGEPLAAGQPCLWELIQYSLLDVRADCSAILQGEAEVRKHAVLFPGPPPRHYERSLAPVRTAQGRVNGWLLVLRDISEQVELARLQEEMFQMLVHDIRSPLAILQGGLGELKTSIDEGDLGKADRLLNLAQRGSDRMLGLVNELMEISKLESGPIRLDCSPVSVATLLHELAAQFLPLISQAGLALEVDASPDLPLVNADLSHTSRVLSNLLDNAVKFTPDGGRIHLSARVETERTPPSLLVAVSDSGEGIPAEIRARIFEKYKQAVGRFARRSGTGLGLYYCKLAVEAQGGEIWVESDGAQGNSFFIRLPLVSES